MTTLGPSGSSPASIYHGLSHSCHLEIARVSISGNAWHRPPPPAAAGNPGPGVAMAFNLGGPPAAARGRKPALNLIPVAAVGPEPETHALCLGQGSRDLRVRESALDYPQAV